MDISYINFYNNLVHLTRNKILYKDFTSQDTLQTVFDFIFKQLELSIREIGYGDASINKNMKNYINIFYSILNKIEKWDNLNKNSQNDIFEEYLGFKNKTLLLPEYFENYRDYLKKNTFNSLLKGVIKPNF